MKKILLGTAALALVACSGEQPATENVAVEAPMEMVEPEAQAAEVNALEAILASQPEEAQARYQYRHPMETIEFLGLEPGMTVVEVLPGAGWYSKILLPYLGSEGSLYGVDYDLEMWPLFGGFASEEFLEARKTWADTWLGQASEWQREGDAALAAFSFGAGPADGADTVDAVVMIRAFHHLNRFEEQGGYRTAALNEVMTWLKPGGLVGIVQHRAAEASDDAWANGDNGYVKQSSVIAAMEEAGFEFVEASEINANPSDQPAAEEFVWRLPPTLATSGEDEELKAKMIEIGESDRMTLKFRKPA